MYKRLNFFCLGVAIFLAAALLVAAYGKIFYPNEFLTKFDLFIGIAEIFLSLSLLCFHRHWVAWAVTGIVLAAWAGYALVWCLWELPCGCLGKMVKLPNGASLAFDLVFCFTSFFLAYSLKGKKMGLWIFAALVAMGGGYLFGEWISKIIRPLA